jgi:hypothetical protein
MELVAGELQVRVLVFVLYVSFIVRLELSFISV